jgi:4-hydroxybutyryl-CoA synthetase (ADP-forming)
MPLSTSSTTNSSSPSSFSEPSLSTSSSSSYGPSPSQSKGNFLAPQSIAVIGASEKPGVGKAIFSNIINGYKGKIYPITPSNPTVFGLKAYKSVLDIPEEVDLAVVATPNKIVPAVMEEVGKKKIKGAIIVSAGFKA